MKVSTPRGPTGRRTSGWSWRRTAAPRVARSLGLRPDLVVGDGDSLGPDGARRAARGGRRDPPRPRRQGRDPTPSWRSSPRSTAARRRSRSSPRSAAASTTRSRMSGCSRWPRSATVPPSCSTRRRASPCIARRAARPSGACSQAGGRATSSRCCRSTPRSSASPPSGSATRSATRRCCVGPSRGLSNVRLEADAAVTVRLRAAARRRDARRSVHSADEHACGRRPGSARRPAGRDRRRPRPRRPARPLDHPLFLSGGHDLRDARRRPASSATSTRTSSRATRTSGASAPTARPATSASRRSTACRSRCSRTWTTPWLITTGRGASRTTTARVHGPRSGPRSWSIPTAGSRRPGRR